jgi:hypothetical protein
LPGQARVKPRHFVRLGSASPSPTGAADRILSTCTDDEVRLIAAFLERGSDLLIQHAARIADLRRRRGANPQAS